MFVYCLLVIGLIILPTTIWYACNAIPYMLSNYFKITHKPYLRMFRDAGAYGEYLTYRRLKEFEEDGARFLFNCYLPKDDGNTSEIDVIMLHRSGVYVFESKNYSGWIFGSETSQTWTQTFKRGRGSVKEHFYNPIKQNSTHIKYLKKQLKEEMPIRSIIVFSERCELKSIEILSSDVSVIRRFDLHAVVERMMHENGESLDEAKIKDIYERLYPFTQVSDDVKERHINNIEKRYKTAVGLDNPLKVIEGETNNADDKDSEILIDESVKDQITHENMICSRCGAKLVLRTSKKGERAGKNFYGCSSFPKCRYIQGI